MAKSTHSPQQSDSSDSSDLKSSRANLKSSAKSKSRDKDKAVKPASAKTHKASHGSSKSSVEKARPKSASRRSKHKSALKVSPIQDNDAFDADTSDKSESHKSHATLPKEKAVPVRKNTIKPDNLIVCHVSAGVPDESVAASLAVSAISGSPWGPINFATSHEVVTFRAQKAMPPESWAMLATSQHAKGAVVAMRVQLSQSRAISLLSAEGIEKVEKKIAKLSPGTGLTIFDLAWPAHIDGAARLHFCRLVEVIRRAPGPAIILITGCTEKEELRDIAKIDDVLTIQKCTSDIDAVLSFKVSAELFGPAWMSQPEPQMLSLLKGSHSNRWRQEVFLADDPNDRELLRLRKAGKTLDEIGKRVGINASNVKRRIDKLMGPGSAI